MQRETPHAFLAGFCDKVPDLTIGSLANARRTLTKTQVSASDFINILDSQKLVQLAKQVRKHLTYL